MKPGKKLLSVLLAVLMLTGVLSVAFSAAAAGISNITLTCPAPAVGGAFPTKTDVTSNASLVIQGVFVKEMNGETAVDATAPFKSGKTYQITFVVATPSPSITFSFGLNASVNGKSCEATRLDSANARVIWTVTLEKEEYTVTVIAQPEYAIDDLDIDELSNGETRIYARPNRGFDFIGLYEGETLLSTEWVYYFTPTHDTTILAKYTQYKGTRVPMNTAGLNEGDKYFMLDEFANAMVKKQGGTPELWKARMNQGELYSDGFSLLFKNTDPTFMEVGDHFGKYGNEIYSLLNPYIQPYIDLSGFVKLKITGTDSVQTGDWYFDVNGCVKEMYTVSGEDWNALSAEEQQSYIADWKASVITEVNGELWYRDSNKTLVLIQSVDGETHKTLLYKDQISGDDAGITLIIYNNIKYKAPTYTVTAKAEAGGSVSGGGTFEQGATVTVKATPNSGYHFTGWYKGSSKVSGSATYSFKATENVTLTAKFEKDAAPSGGDNQNANRCHWCGKTHEGFFQKIIGFFHRILAAIFGAKY